MDEKAKMRMTLDAIISNDAWGNEPVEGRKFGVPNVQMILDGNGPDVVLFTVDGPDAVDASEMILQLMLGGRIAFALNAEGSTDEQKSHAMKWCMEKMHPIAFDWLKHLLVDSVGGSFTALSNEDVSNILNGETIDPQWHDPGPDDTVIPIEITQQVKAGHQMCDALYPIYRKGADELGDEIDATIVKEKLGEYFEKLDNALKWAVAKMHVYAFVALITEMTQNRDMEIYPEHLSENVFQKMQEQMGMAHGANPPKAVMHM